jgi:plastocyanin
MRYATAIFASVIVLTVAPAMSRAKPPKAATHTVTIRNMRYSPATLTIKAGDSVTWVNADQRDHTVAANDGSFASGNIGPGASYTYRFAKDGKFTYGCNLHPRMRAAVNVQ